MVPSPPELDGRQKKKLSHFAPGNFQEWSITTASRTTNSTMGSKLAEKKRKTRDAEPESEDELADGAFDGVLSQSEDEFDELSSEDEEYEEDDESGSGQSDGDEDDDDEILSDDIPSDVDGEDTIKKLLKDTEDLEIEEPGVDPKRTGEEEEERNYRIEKDANGNERYVYEFVPLCDTSWLDTDSCRQRNRPRLRFRRLGCPGPCQYHWRHSVELL